VEAFSADPSDNGVSGCALYLARPVLATSVHAFVLNAFSGLANLRTRRHSGFDLVLGVDG
jgi:hypothetical protein